jgi:hypothetical protein
MYLILIPEHIAALFQSLQEQGCGVGVRRNFVWSRKEFLGGVGVGKNVPTLTPTSV